MLFLIFLLYNKIMKLEFIKPYTDEQLYYNEITGKYQLTRNYCLNLIGGNPYQDDATLDKRILLNTRVVYSYILTMGNSNNKRYNRCLLEYTKGGRKILKEVLSAQFLADAETGYNDLIKQLPINFDTYKVLERNAMLKNLLSVEAQNILENSKNDLYGYNLISQISYGYIAEIEGFLNDIEE